MAITHAAVKTAGDIGTAAEWNDDHVVTGNSLPKNSTTLIVAASDSLDTERADYICDGVDDDLTIEEALGDLPAWGGTVTLLEGNFVLGSGIDVAIANTVIEGQGNGTIIHETLTGHAIKIDGLDNCVVRSLKIVRAAGVGANDAGVWVRGSDHCIVEYVWVDGVTTYSFRVDNGSTHTRILNCFIDNCLLHPIYLNGGELTLVEGCGIENTTSQPIFINNNDHAIISKNTLLDNGDDNIQFNQSDECIIESNIIINPGGDAIEVDALSNDNLIHGNMCKGEVIDDNGVGTVVANNVT